MLSLTAKPSPASRPAANAHGTHRQVAPAAARRMASAKAATAATPNTIAWLSTCSPATSTRSSSGLHVHSSAARSWRLLSPAASRCSSSPVTANPARLSRDSTNTVSRTEVPPMSDASAWPPVASTPYTEGLVLQSSTARAIGSPSRASWLGVVRYGLWPVASIRPYAA